MIARNIVWVFSRSIWIGLILLGLLYSCKEPVNNLEEKGRDGKTKQAEFNIDLVKTMAGYNRDNAVTVNVKYDHFFKTPKKYKGYPISAILDSCAKAMKFDTSKAMVLFECRDGYNPVMDFSKLFGNTKGYLVFKDLEQADQKNWPDSIAEKFVPWYLVWDDVKKEDQSFMWPYGLTAIKLISSIDSSFTSIYPGEESTAQNGFVLFRDNCIKCHSVNKIGGSIGPEFNVPRNITEYWKEEDIISFAKNPASFRYNSHMPAVTNIDDKDFKEIILYLQYMKNHKVTY